MVAAAAAPLLGGGCSTAGNPSEFTTGSGAGGPGTGGSGGEDAGTIFNDAGVQGGLRVSPTSPILKVQLPMQGQTLPFQCLDDITQEPVPGATWEISNLDVGTLSDGGVFTPNGLRTGTATVRCKTAEAEAETSLKVIIHAVDNPNGLSQAQIDVLTGPPGQADPQWKFLYPYDRTVFPRGILAPEIHLGPGSSPGTAFYVHIVATDFEYEGFFAGSSASTQLQMSQSAWDALTTVASGKDVEVHVSKLFNAQKYGPIKRTWKIAPGRLHGIIFYNTYDSPLAGGTGAIMRIKGNSPTPEVLLGNCTVCHSISADGTTAAAANDNGPGGVFDLSNGQVNPPNVWATGQRAAFAALYPDQGQVLVTNGAPSNFWPPNTPGTSSSWVSELYTKTGQLIPGSGIEAFYAQTPVFSHDGARLAFADRSPVAPYPSVLGILDYDAVAQQFSGYDVLATPQPGRHLSWPAFTPDNRFVVFQDGQGDDLATWSGNTGRLYAVDVQTKQLVYLANLNGDGYMPGGIRDENKNYEPTISPIPSGGYFWVMFTSRRTFGNKLTGSEWETKRLWVAALDINPQAAADFSHPAFYISGQELTSGNSRGFWSHDPSCKANGDECVSGNECCEGFCNLDDASNPPVYRCGPSDGECADELEPCEISADCCDPEHQCINNVCTQVVPQ
ncbi:MAG TPA: dickkopf-related protein [Candidatus Nanopelagicales bacterium]|nr:dickkopf-related protein [Candidatus Nanopelagicales bacterium]